MLTFKLYFTFGHLANDFCKSCRDEEEEENVAPALCQRRMKYVSTNYVDDLEELSGIDIGSLNCFIGSSEWFWN